MTFNSIIPVILSGGSGTRLWPLSRESYPKQFLALDSRTKKTLLQKTYERLVGLKGLGNPSHQGGIREKVQKRGRAQKFEQSTGQH